MKEHLTWHGEHIIQYPDEILRNRTPEAYIIFLIGVTSINLTKEERKKEARTMQKSM